MGSKGLIVSLEPLLENVQKIKRPARVTNVCTLCRSSSARRLHPRVAVDQRDTLVVGGDVWTTAGQ